MHILAFGFKNKRQYFRICVFDKKKHTKKHTKKNTKNKKTIEDQQFLKQVRRLSLNLGKQLFWKASFSPDRHKAYSPLKKRV